MLEREGCELAVLWPDFAGGKAGRVAPGVLAAEIAAQDKNTVIKLQQATRQAIVNFTGGKMPPASE